MEAIYLFGILFLFIMLGVPISISLGMASLGVILMFEPVTLNFQIRTTIAATESYPLLAVPLFILAGELMYSGGLSKRMISFADSIVGQLKGSLAYANVLSSTFFAAISGSSPATVSAIGTNMIPEMEKRGYPKEYSTALTAASGMIGVMIPPSIPFVMYGISAEQSVRTLFTAGIVPGLLFAIGFMVTAYILYVKKGLECRTNKFSFKRVWESYKSAFWALLAPVIILGGIYGGYFSPTEGSAVAVFYAMFVGLFIYKELTLKSIFVTFARGALTCGSVLALVAFASVFGKILTIENVPQALAEMLTTLTDNKIIILLLINIFLLFVGMFMETIASIIILTPILFPVAQAVGVDPILFGVIITVNLAIGFCTPPLGVNLFVASGVSGISIEKISKEIIPYFAVMIVLLLLISYVPEISLALPKMLGI